MDDERPEEALARAQIMFNKIVSAVIAHLDPEAGEALSEEVQRAAKALDERGDQTAAAALRSFLVRRQ